MSAVVKPAGPAGYLKPKDAPKAKTSRERACARIADEVDEHALEAGVHKQRAETDTADGQLDSAEWHKDQSAYHAAMAEIKKTLLPKAAPAAQPEPMKKG